MPKRAAAKLTLRLSFEAMPSPESLEAIKLSALSAGATIKAADLSYLTPTKLSLK